MSEPQPTGVTEVARQFISHLNELWPQAKKLRTERSFSNTLTNISFGLGAQTLESVLDIQEDATIFIPNSNFINTRPDSHRIQVVHDISFMHAPQWYAPKTRAWHRLARAGTQLTKAEKIIAVSEWTARDIAKHLHIPAQKIFVVNPATPKPLAGTAPQLPFFDEPFFLFLGTQERRKNIHGVVEAWRALAQKSEFKNHHLVIAGAQGYGAPSEKTFPARTHALTYVSANEKWWLLRNARALVFPSFFEGFGLPPLEAMAVGCPTIISDCTALPQTMGDAALPVSPFDVKQIALGMEAVVLDPQLRNHLIQKGFNRAAWYSISRQREQLVLALSAPTD